MKKKFHVSTQQSLFQPSEPDPPASKFIAAYRVMLVRDKDLPFEAGALSNSREAQTIIRKLIETCGQSDREQFCVVLLDNKNVVIGLNIVSIGAVSYAHEKKERARISNIYYLFPDSIDPPLKLAICW